MFIGTQKYFRLTFFDGPVFVNGLIEKLRNLFAVLAAARQFVKSLSDYGVPLFQSRHFKTLNSSEAMYLN